MNQILSSDFTTMSFWRVEWLAFKVTRQNGDAAVVFRACDLSTTVFTHQQAALAITRHPIGLIGRLAKHAEDTGGFIPPHDAVVGQIGEQHIPAICEPSRPLSPPHSPTQAFHFCVGEAVMCKAWVKLPYGRIRHTGAWTPISIVHYSFPSVS
ncbi:hypothetical protein PPS11_22769 [Pseudomonas putida S11]|nr:hypothetical protein PPS11_22769 [Pseudomonas putida S11]